MLNFIFRVNKNNNNTYNATSRQLSTKVTVNCQRTPDEPEKPHSINSGESGHEFHRPVWQLLNVLIAFSVAWKRDFFILYQLGGDFLESVSKTSFDVIYKQMRFDFVIPVE